MNEHRQSQRLEFMTRLIIKSHLTTQTTSKQEAKPGRKAHTQIKQKQNRTLAPKQPQRGTSKAQNERETNF